MTLGNPNEMHCLFCGGDASEPNHASLCDGRQGHVEAQMMPTLKVGAEFNGSDYNHDDDHARLTGQLLRVYEVMANQEWRTLGEIEALTGDPPASISAQLRHLRKKRFGSYVVNKRPRGEREHGLWEYQLSAECVQPRTAGPRPGEPGWLASLPAVSSITDRAVTPVTTDSPPAATGTLFDLF